MAQYEFIRVDIEDGSKSDFIANFGEKLANSFIKAMKNPNMPNACKNIDKWNKFYRLAKEEKLKGEELISFVELDCDTILNEFDLDYMDEFVDTNDVEKALNISKDKSMRLLKKMIAIGFIEVTGKGQKTEYILK